MSSVAPSSLCMFLNAARAALPRTASTPNRRPTEEFSESRHQHSCATLALRAKLLHNATIDAAFCECSLGGSEKKLLKEVNLKFKELLAKTWTLVGGGKAQKS